MLIRLTIWTDGRDQIKMDAVNHGRYGRTDQINNIQDEDKCMEKEKRERHWWVFARFKIV